MMAEKMILLCKSAQTSSTQEIWPQTEHPLTRMDECQARALSAENLFKGLLHPPFLVSRPHPLLRDTLVPILEPVQVLYSPKPRTIRAFSNFIHPKDCLSYVS